MSITAANTVFMLTQATLLPNAVQLQGFAADDVTDMDPVDILEELMGVDGTLSFGFVWMERRQKVSLQADSVSNAVFDRINAQQEAVQDVYPLGGSVTFPALGLIFNLINGALKTYKPMPQAQKILRPREYRLVWNKVIVAPAPGS
jgi:hypothetical protein